MNGTIAGTNWTWSQGAPFNVTVNLPPAVPALNGPVDGGSAPSSALLNVSVSDPDGDPLTVTYYGRPKTVAAAPDFTVVAIPDTQHYVDNASRAGTFTVQTNWIVNNRGPLNIAFASHLGDIVENQDQFEIEWQRADASLTVLDINGVPYALSPGNHDQNNSGVANFYDQYFPPSRYLGRPWYGGYMGQEAGDLNRLNKDNYNLFSVGGLDFLVIQMELDWPDYAVTWADKIIKRYPNRRVILSTHVYLNTSNARPSSAQFRSNGTSAEAVWQQIVKPNCNVFMVINGHYPGEGRRTDLNNCGQPVHQVLTDYQDRANGGDGWLRYYTFKPSENKIYAYTYSPTRNGGNGEFETDASSQFVLDYNMQGTAFSVIGSNTGVSSGAATTKTWNNLLAGGEYEWYVEVNDGRSTTTGPIWNFSAAATANTPPVAVNDTYLVEEDRQLIVPISGVLGNDQDADDDALTAILVQPPQSGSLFLAADGAFTYTPGDNFNGLVTFTYRASDASSQSAPATVSVFVNALNDPPIATDDTVTAAEDTPLSIPVLLNDTDVDDDGLTITSIGTPVHGSAVVNGAGDYLHAGRRLHGCGRLHLHDRRRARRQLHGHGRGHRHERERPAGGRERCGDDRRGHVRGHRGRGERHRSRRPRRAVGDQRWRARPRHRRHQGKRCGDLHAGAELQRTRQLHLHDRRRPCRGGDGDGQRHRHGAERRAGGGDRQRGHRRGHGGRHPGPGKRYGCRRRHPDRHHGEHGCARQHGGWPGRDDHLYADGQLHGR